LYGSPERLEDEDLLFSATELLEDEEDLLLVSSIFPTDFCGSVELLEESLLDFNIALGASLAMLEKEALLSDFLFCSNDLLEEELDEDDFIFLMG